MKKLFVAMVFLAIFACPVLAQQNPNPQNKGTGSAIANSNSSSTSNAGAVSSNNNVNNFAGADDRQFINALPGTSGVTIPGAVRNNDPWGMYRGGQSIPMTDLVEIKNPEKFAGKSKDAYVVGSIPENTDPIHLIDWWPKDGGFPADRVLGQFIIRGKPGEVDLRYVTVALSVAKALTHSERCAVRYRTDNVAITSTSNTGGSAAGAGMPFASAFASALGAMFGKSKSHNEESPEIEAMCLNRGPYLRPPAAANASTTETPSESVSQSTSKPAPASPPAPAEVKVEKAAVDPCADFADIHFSVKFAFDRPRVADSIPGQPYKPKESDFWTDPKERDLGSKPLSEWLADIRRAADWIKSHPGCKQLQSVGHASIEGSDKYNLFLGDRRGWVIDYLLRQDGVSVEQLKQWVSLGKRQLVQYNERNSNSRFVDLEVIDRETGP